MAFVRSGLLENAEVAVIDAPAKTLTEVARACRVSVRTLRRAVRADRRMSLREWHSALLARTAEVILAEQQTSSIKEVAFALGFPSQQSFARRFRQATGLTPTGFRETCRGGGSVTWLRCRQGTLIGSDCG